MSSGNNQQPSLIGGHAEYIKGATESTIGSVTGSQAWTTSGEQAKAHAVDAMKAAGENRDPTQGYGQVEQKLGQATGCEGMVKEGAASKKPE
ncbi:uncharacterized protein F4822DRAFT_415633 [Hypoxylon trugodes]|uniref:uncharacterized protein n=1 Tax=Hypoxylon trugodes TaxID=326681 RepID=UPI00219CE7F0|nr:uncharacterized protein F4822DRAFT_415633 [Hypoxylon trugodes]KAI1384583.1 hypothetical protein F4822DRAFT_415633 [Hypoxylon trugodes]